jgi:hypothetical protein
MSTKETRDSFSVEGDRLILIFGFASQDDQTLLDEA